ncbi:MAG: precorrin-6A reductase, partial [Eubacteriales bacterium]|nr:precorrin-6A reductase [Eubacteriales bacterium]
MSKVLIYGGTTEGRLLAESLAQGGIHCLVLVATEYGEQMLRPLEEGLQNSVRVLQGRLTAEEMAALYGKEKPDVIVDATHPYAELVKKNIWESLEGYRKVPFFRVERKQEVLVERENARYFDTVSECVSALQKTTGNILLTTGSKNLPEFCRDNSLRNRLYVRVLPSVESLEICQNAGITGNRIIAMQGPFSEAMNEQMLQETDSKILVMKESGRIGGEASRMEAAQRAGAVCYIIRRPGDSAGVESLETPKPAYGERAGMTLEQVLAEIRKRLEGGNCPEFPERSERPECLEGESSGGMKPGLRIALLGIGMNGVTQLTQESQGIIAEADYIFGAMRMIAPFTPKKAKFPYYQAEKILEQIRVIQEERREAEEFEPIRIGILFSGDTGFYSGCRLLVPALREIPEAKVTVYPGISSVSALAARIQESWQDARILSTHGVPAASWIPELLDAVRHNGKVFAITSGVEDLRKIGNLLCGEADVQDCGISAGFDLGSESEQILELLPEECQDVAVEGLCTVQIKNPHPMLRRLTPGMADETFSRDKVPMTKEEVRILSLCQLHLREGAVAYDIGCGTGSVTAEIAALSPSIRVYGIEKKEGAADLTRRNISKMGLPNVTVVEGEAPECLPPLPTPTHVFIGGSSGNLMDIMDYLMALNREIRVVLNAVSLETLAEIRELETRYGLELDVRQIQVSRSRKLGSHHLMQ